MRKTKKPTYDMIKAAIVAALEKEIGPDRMVLPATEANEFGPATKEMVLEDCWGDYRFYSPEEWERRGETIGNKSHLSMTFEGIIYEYINYGQTDGEIEMRQMGMKPRRKDVMGAIQKALDPFDLYAELGFAWSLHVYDI